MKRTLLLSLLYCFFLACNNNQDQKTALMAGHEGHMMPSGTGNYCDSVNSGLITEDTMKGSPHRIAMSTINGTHIHIEYGSPGVKGRMIWGGLVAYDKIWATGAHNATSIQFSRSVKIGGTTIPKGTYALFTIPGKQSWQAIINSRYEQHLADDYSAQEDLVRINVIPVESAMTPRLTFSIHPADNNGGEIKMQWERLSVIIPFKTIEQ